MHNAQCMISCQFSVISYQFFPVSNFNRERRERGVSVTETPLYHLGPPPFRGD